MNAVILSLLLLQDPSSLYSDDAPNLFLFRDQKARTVGDIVTIQVIENATATNSATTATKKKGDGKLSAPALGGLEKAGLPMNLSNILQGAGGLNFDGTGTTSRTGQLQAAISARVVEVFPNGDMRIEGNKDVAINGERQILTIRGLVRGKDITPANRVMSTSIADMDVRFNGKGIVADANKPGWLYKMFKLIGPF